MQEARVRCCGVHFSERDTRLEPTFLLLLLLELVTCVTQCLVVNDKVQEDQHGTIEVMQRFFWPKYKIPWALRLKLFLYWASLCIYSVKPVVLSDLSLHNIHSYLAQDLAQKKPVYAVASLIIFKESPSNIAAVLLCCPFHQ